MRYQPQLYWLAIERPAPFGQVSPKRTYQLGVDQIDPHLRLAIRLIQPVHIAERIICDHCLQLVLDGRVKVSTRRGTDEYSAGELFHIPPFVPHRIDTYPEETLDHIAIHFDFAASVPGHVLHTKRRKPYAVQLTGGWKVPERLPVKHNGELEASLFELVRLAALDSVLGRLQAKARLSFILAQILQSRESANDASGGISPERLQTLSPIERAAEYLRHHSASGPSVAEAARVAGLSPSRFAHRFAETIGLSPARFVRQVRVEKAKYLLSNPDLTLKEIARETGFNDAFHLSRVFSQSTGSSPLAYRRQIRPNF